MFTCGPSCMVPKTQPFIRVYCALRTSEVSRFRHGIAPVVTGCRKVVSFPAPTKKWKEGLVFWMTFLVTWDGSYCIKNVIASDI